MNAGTMKRQINLYGAEFRPRRQWASLPQMLLAWGLLAVLLAGMGALYAWQQQGVSRELAQVRVALDVQRNEAKRLDAALARHQADEALQRQLVDKRDELSAKQGLMRQLGSLSLQKSQGYAGIMSDLARLGSDKLALERIEINEGHINLAGVARSSQDVPAWVNRFKQMPTLAGKEFGELTLSRDKAGRLQFQLSGIAREKP
ncbi:MSHA biogenesis protein MshI1 [Aeromonas molluscorum 848]|uniref:MSHA biogenesis protein MshI1 n=2 Tax=Aeromonas molluscorum TaxID=271417 RepID=R1H9V1_9GAMM|nr:MSHA biogenesis protein MshI1 [Aeromonas molluscorum 848]